MLTCRRGAFVPPPPSSSASSQSQSQPSSQSQLRPPHSNMYPNALSALLAEDSPVPSMLSEAQRPPADPSGATENLLMLAIQERLQNQLRPTANLFNHQLNLNQTITQDANRLFQQMLPLLGLPPILPGLPNPLDLGCLPGTSMTHPLWQHNLCAWPECNHPCENLAVFLTHLSQAHTFNERSTSDMRVQVELVDSLEHRLTKERNRLQAMMQHLHMKQSPDTTTPTIGKIETNTSPLLSPKQEPAFSAISSLPTQSAAVQSSLPSVSLSISEAATTPLSIPAPSVVSSEGSPTSGDQQSQKPFVPRRSRISDKSVLPISADIARNRDFYRTNDVRPPYTYASLIRQAIMESPDCQLTLNEIYTWFTETFAYFRRNAATWKVRYSYNLSFYLPLSLCVLCLLPLLIPPHTFAFVRNTILIGRCHESHEWRSLSVVCVCLCVVFMTTACRSRVSGLPGIPRQQQQQHIVRLCFFQASKQVI
ncbi:hypothetical protein Y032_0191g1299 [Ancylostoma ceylanicum]|uniref:Fork-head domain-containing protein n=1 Tax=Ancylostoma ceylanicum TaxID=53326 RepID=A0A016SQL4_9BILA|nr:hypothetical protein Y032_0191g1299 [Ancylostoma ceylanicum]